MQGGALIQFLVIGQYTPKQLIAFKAWYLAKYRDGIIPRQIKRIKGTDDFEGKFVTHWQEWQIAIKPKSATAPQTPPPALPVLTETNRQIMLAMLKGTHNHE